MTGAAPSPKATLGSVTTRSGTLLLLVRHGQTTTTGKLLPGRSPGLHLTPRGRAQAEEAARRISRLVESRGSRADPCAVYASPLERTKETARPIAGALGVPVHSARSLIECDVGEWTGRELARLRRLRQWHAVTSTPSLFRFPGGESFAEMQARSLDGVATLCARHPGGLVVAVSHADVIKGVLASALGTPLDLFQRLVVSPCSLSAVHVAPEGMHVLCVNSTATLDDLTLS